MSFHQFVSIPNEFVVSSQNDILVHEDILMDIYDNTPEEYLPSWEETHDILMEKAPELLPNMLKHFDVAEGRHHFYNRNRAARKRHIIRRGGRPHVKVVYRHPIKRLRRKLRRAYHRPYRPYSRPKGLWKRLLRALVVGSILPRPSAGHCQRLYTRNAYNQIVRYRDAYGRPLLSCTDHHGLTHRCVKHNGKLVCERPILKN